MPFPTLEDIIGKSPLVRLQRINTDQQYSSRQTRRE
jgi:hypothetical protein